MLVQGLCDGGLACECSRLCIKFVFQDRVCWGCVGGVLGVC